MRICREREKDIQGAWDMPKMCLRYALDLPEICLKLPDIYVRSDWDMPDLFLI